MTFLRPLQWVAVVVTLVLTVGAVLFGTPRTPQLSEHSSGDPALAAQLRTLASTSGQQALAATVITPDTVSHAAIGETTPGSGTTIQPEDPIAVGSIPKTFDGFLLADAAERGEVGLDDPVGMHLSELQGTPLGSVTLTELASHRGGVPSLTPSVAWRTLPMVFSGVNPYGGATRPSVLQEISDLEPEASRGSVGYSNLGATLLGWALADAAGYAEWEDYVRERLLDPAGAPATFARSAEELPTGAVPGFDTNGFRPEPWTGSAFLPAGVGAYLSPTAMTTYTQAILREDVPGITALDPRFDAGGPTEIGLAWYTTSTPDGRSITWHNGRTNGSSTILVIDRTADRAVFVAGNTDRPVDEIGFALLTGEPIPTGEFNPLTLIIPAVVAFVVVLWLWSALRSRDRVAIISAFAGALAILALARPLGSWSETAPAVWAGMVVLTAAGVLAAVLRWPRLPWQADRFRVPRAAYAALNVVIAAAAVAVTATLR